MRAPALLLVAVLTAVVPTAVSCSDPESSKTPVSETTTSGDQDQPAGALSPDRLPVLIARSAIPAGTPAATAIDEGLIQEATATRAEFPEDAVIDSKLIDGMVAAQLIPRDSIITAGMFATQDGESPTSSSLSSSTSSSSAVP